LERLAFPFELEQVEPEDGTFSGRAIVYGRQFDTMFGPLVIEPGAFADSIAQDGDRVKILYQHFEPIGRPLELEDRPDGVHVKGKLSLTTLGRDALTLIRDHVVEELSAGIERVETLEEKGKVPRLKRGELREISLVTWGAAGREGAKIYEVHNEPRIADLPLGLTRALGVLAEHELKWGKLPEPEIPIITAEEIGEKLKQHGITAIAVSDFERMIEEFTKREK
jgi:HK97 family phage prohead protease